MMMMKTKASVGCQNITAKKPESTRRTIFNRDSTIQLIVQISSGNVNSSVRARAKTHGRTPVSIELPRGSRCLHLLAQTPTSFGLECPHLHCTRVHNKGLQMPTSPCARAQLKTRASKRCPRRPPCVHPKDARVGLIRAWKDTRAAPLCVHTKIHAPPPYA